MRLHIQRQYSIYDTLGGANLLRATRRESGLESGAGLRLTALDTTISGRKQDGRSARTESHVRVAQFAAPNSEDRRLGVIQEDLQGKGLRQVAFVLAVGRRHHLGNIVFVSEEVDDVEEAAEIAVLGIFADGNECHRNTCCNTHGVLNVKLGALRLVRERRQE